VEAMKRDADGGRGDAEGRRSARWHAGDCSRGEDPVDVQPAQGRVGSVVFAAVFIPGGVDSAKTLAEEAMALLSVNEACKHGTALAVTGVGFALLPTSNGGNAAAKGADGKTDHSQLGCAPEWWCPWLPT